MPNKESEFYHKFNQSLQNDTVKTQSPSVFWKHISQEKSEKGWKILADGRNIKTPLQKPFMAPHKKAGELICQEWNNQTDYIRPRHMPLSRLVMTIIDKLEVDEGLQKDWLNSAFSYLETDLLLFPSPYPQTLQKAEKEAWKPILDWASHSLHHEFKPNINLTIDPYNKKAQAALAQTVSFYNIWQQMAFVLLCQSCGSALLALATTEHATTEEHLIKASLVQEYHQSCQWGEDPELTAFINNKSFELKSLFAFLHTFPPARSS